MWLQSHLILSQLQQLWVVNDWTRVHPISEPLHIYRYAGRISRHAEYVHLLSEITTRVPSVRGAEGNKPTQLWTRDRCSPIRCNRARGCRYVVEIGWRGMLSLRGSEGERGRDLSVSKWRQLVPPRCWSSPSTLQNVTKPEYRNLNDHCSQHSRICMYYFNIGCKYEECILGCGADRIL